MLLWINGPFGGGKTQTAHELHRRLPGSVVCDPELVGYGLHRMLPASLRGDFQDLPAWRQGVFEVLDLALTRWDGPVVVPMTLVVPGYFDEIVGRLRQRGHRVHHVALLADRPVVVARLQGRVVGRPLQRWVRPEWTPPSERFAVAQLDRCLDALQDARFAQHLRTDGLTVPQVAERVAAGAGLPLAARRGGSLRQAGRELWTTLHHLHLG